ncbi:hypothetical protein [Thauera sp. WH-1]|uniref:hypothetical protein n=1 Tax=Thauera sp. WH-1 TaxID=3398230 RepID=UPI0039FC01EE
MIDNFPAVGLEREDINPAIRAFGRRFYKDQTPLEYLAEFLLCFNAEKFYDEANMGAGIPELASVPQKSLSYRPESRIALKLFSFFPSSKLETRHPVHVKRFKQLIEDMSAAVETDFDGDKKRAVRVLQQLFSGFVGVAGQRTWVTHSFIPASRHLLSREVDWRHTDAINANVDEWDTAQSHFTTGSHNFMARGGEMLFLQLWHALRAKDSVEIAQWLESEYAYIDWPEVSQSAIEGLDSLVIEIDAPLARLGSVIEWAGREAPAIEEMREKQKFGWIHRESWREAALFAWEIANITASGQDPLRKVRVLQNLCCMHVLRSLCFQAVRWVRAMGELGAAGDGFAGGYAWITAGPHGGTSSDLGKVSNASVSAIEELLFKAVRSTALPKHSAPNGGEDRADLADAHGYKLFRSLGKHIGLIIPRQGPMRFSLSSSLVETAVAALIPPGERLPFDEFLWRLYRHFGIAVGPAQIEAAAGMQSAGFHLAPRNDCAAWLEDELKRGGLLIALSDATPLVANPA